MPRAAVVPLALALKTHIDQEILARVLEERRHWLRVDLESRRITADAQDPQNDIAVLDITPAGIRIASETPVDVGAMFMIDVMLNDGQRVNVPSIVTMCTWYGGDISGHLLTVKF